MAKYHQDLLIKEKKHKNSSTLGKILKNPILYSTLFLGSTIFAYVNSQNKKAPGNEYSQLTEQIENNISSVYGFKKFQLQAFNSTNESSKYYINLVGYATKIPGQPATYTGLKYQVNEKIYTIITSPSGNTQQNYDDLLYVLYCLTSITKQKADSFEQIEPDFVNLNAKKDSTFILTNLTTPTVNTLSSTISFEIKAVTSQEVNEQEEHIATLKTYIVSADLIPELIDNPDLIYNQYTNGQTTFNLLKEEKLKIKNYDVSMLNFGKPTPKDSSVEL